MDLTDEQYLKAVMSGSVHGASASTMRAVMRAFEPLYAGAMMIRNHLYNSGALSSRTLPRPVISIGNITTGGTGKTPMVSWLAGRLRDEGRHVAVLSRGYRAQGTNLGDESRMLDAALNTPGSLPVLFRANPDRVAGGEQLLREHPEIDVIILDDAFQHRRLARDLDIVLVSAVEPFGFGHVLPRGLLREPLSGLSRADAIVLTHADQIAPPALSNIESRNRRYSPAVPIYRASHQQTGLLNDDPGFAQQPMDHLARHCFFAFGGIADPCALERQLSSFGATYVGRHWFDDHHHYTPGDLEHLRAQASAAGAVFLVTTEKDWVKVAPLAPSNSAMPIWRIQMEIRFLRDDAERLLQQVRLRAFS